jgi:hypothetical protein
MIFSPPGADRRPYTFPMFLAPPLKRPGSAASAASPSRSGAVPAQPNPHWSRLVQRDPVQVPHDNASERYQQAQKEIADFEAGAPYFAFDFTPSTGNGFFDARYYQRELLATVKVKFLFVGSPREQWGLPDTAPDPDWANQQEKDDWKALFRRQVADKWNQQSYRLYNSRPGWEQVSAQVRVEVVDVDHYKDQGIGPMIPHFTTQVVKIPKGRKYQSETNSPNAALGRARGTQILSSEDVVPQDDGAGHKQRVGIHESGHYFGLGDSYVDKIKNTKEVSHSRQAQAETGVGVPIKNDDRLMSRGEKMDLTDAVTFLEAIRAATRIPDWTLKPTRLKGLPGSDPFHEMPAPKQAVA